MVVRHSIMRWLEHITFTKLINLVGPMEYFNKYNKYNNKIFV